MGVQLRSRVPAERRSAAVLCVLSADFFFFKAAARCCGKTVHHVYVFGRRKTSQDPSFCKSETLCFYKLVFFMFILSLLDIEACLCGAHLGGGALPVAEGRSFI